MAQTKAGAAKAMATILAKDPNFYKKMASLGGKASNTGGFYGNPEAARIAGLKAAGVPKKRRNA